MAIGGVNNSVSTLQTSQAVVSKEKPIKKQVENKEVSAKAPEAEEGIKPQSTEDNGSDKIIISQHEDEEPVIQQPANEQLKKALEEVNKNLVDSEAIFGIHEETHRLTIKIVNKETKKVIREFPPEKTLDMISKLWEMAGILVDEKG